MSTPASIKKHPIHPMLVVLPIGLWVFSLACDLIYFLGRHAAIWSQVAYYCIGGGIAGALLAAIPGSLDFLSIRNPEVKKIGKTHMILNLIAVGLFALNLWFRSKTFPGEPWPVVLSAVTLAIVGIAVWLGGEMVYVHQVGVNTQSIDEKRTQRKAG